MDRGTISAAGGVKELFDRPKTVAAARLTGAKISRPPEKREILRWRCPAGASALLPPVPSRTDSGQWASGLIPLTRASPQTAFPPFSAAGWRNPLSSCFSSGFRDRVLTARLSGGDFQKSRRLTFSRRSGSLAGAGAAADIKCNETMRPRQGSRQAAFSSFSPSSGGASL